MTDGPVGQPGQREPTHTFPRDPRLAPTGMPVLAACSLVLQSVLVVFIACTRCWTCLCNPRLGKLDVCRIKVDPQVVASERLSDRCCRATADKGVEHKIARS